MQFGFLSECQTPRGMTHHTRYWEVIEEAVYAEEMGFDFFGTSEQHFICDGATVSAPECFYPMIFAKTSRLRLRHCITLLPFNFKHPIRVAERVATLDIVSRGRIELGTGRAKHVVTNRGVWDQSKGHTCPMDRVARGDRASVHQGSLCL